MQDKKEEKMKKIFTVLVLSLLMFACNDNAANKIKKENLELAKERDSKIRQGGAKSNSTKQNMILERSTKEILLKPFLNLQIVVSQN